MDQLRVDTGPARVNPVVLRTRGTVFLEYGNLALARDRWRKSDEN
jgi:hypothetical protein